MIGKFGTFEYPLAERYRFESELGRGAMGTVYRAHDVRLDRPVAIKMLHGTLTNELGVARFQSEIRIAASLHHPNIVAVHDSGETDGRLYYVMDYLGGETLRDRLRREKQLSVEHALEITEQIAEGLQFAHDRGVVHRDIKPENILIADGCARVVDFGLARALGDVDADRLTASGLSVGTPQYLSPEQAAAEKHVGPAADQYGLACVLYEMLVGEPPFTGATATAVAMRHITEVPTPLRARRRSTPVSVEAAVMRALEKVPADRFESVAEFAALTRSSDKRDRDTPVQPRRPSSHRIRRRTIFVVGALSILLTIGMAVQSVDSDADWLKGAGRWIGRRPLDSAEYVVFPLTSAGPRAGAADSTQARAIGEKLRDALARWRDVSAIGPTELGVGLPPVIEGENARTDLASIARSIGAERYLVGKLERQSAPEEPVKLRLELYDASHRARSRSVLADIPSAGLSVDSTLAHVAYQILFNSEGAGVEESAAMGTSNRRAFEQYLAAKRSLHSWSLLSADSQLTRALRDDPSFPQASLALAEVREWTHDDVPGIDALVARALGRASALSVSDRLRASALADLLAHRFPSACARYDTLAHRDSLDFVAWYGIGECNRRDHAVIESPKSPTGYVFRASRQRAITALRRGFDLLPSIDACCIERADHVQRRPLLVHAAQFLSDQSSGTNAPTFLAYSEVANDTLSFYPRPATALVLSAPETHLEAVQRQRRWYFEIASRRLAVFPNSGEALEEVADALELVGNAAAAIDTVHRARSIAADTAQQIRLAVYEVWLRFKLAMPGNVPELRAVRRLADSLLTHAPRSAGTSLELATVAELVRRGDVAAQLASAAPPDGNDPTVPREVAAAANAFLAYSAAGGATDSLRRYEALANVAIANQVLPQSQIGVRQRLLTQAILLALPVYVSPTLDELQSQSDLAAAAWALRHGNRQRAKALLDARKAARQHSRQRPADLTLDALYPEAWLRVQLGDTAEALATLLPTLDAIRLTPVSELADVARAGALVRAIALCATLAKPRDADLARWTRALEGFGLTATP